MKSSNLSIHRATKNGYNYTHSHKPRYASHCVSTPEAHRGSQIKVVSYNIRFSKKIDQAIKTLKTNPKVGNADIILLQEMDPVGVEKMAHSLGFNYVYYPASVHPAAGKDFGNAVLSKWPFLSDRKIILPKPKTKKLQRIAVEATLMICNKKITVYSIHLDIFLNASQRALQLTQLIQDKPSSDYYVFAGDFNTFTESNRNAVTKAFKEANFELATRDAHWTYRHWYLLNKKSCVDYVFTSGMQVIESGKITNHKASDHHPIWAELKFIDKELNDNLNQI